MKHHLKSIRQTAWFRLASTYLLIIMMMSIGFSFVFYNTSWHELGRQIPPHGAYQQMMHGGGPGTSSVNSQTGALTDGDDQPGLDQFLQNRVQEGRTVLLDRLLILNATALILGSILSYYLAKRTLQPIEEAMDAQVQFVSDASHELRTPLTAIQASNEVALRNPNLTLPKAKQVIASNSEEAAKLKLLSDGLLNLARHDKTTLSLEPVSLQAAVSKALTQIVPAAQAKGIAVDDQVPNGKVRAHEQALVQILVILLDNAIKYSPDKTTVHLTATNRGKQVSLHVRDEGVGIRASDLPHIFRRFYRADTARSAGSQHGYGLGLSIANKLAEQQAATLSAQSEPGKGSTFTIRLPAAESKT